MAELLFKVIIIGDPTVGKTSFVQRYVNDSYRRDYKMTIGVDFALKVIKWSDNRTIKLQLWDIAGQERFTSMTRVYYKDAHACIVMFDLSQRATFQSAVKWKKDLDTKCSLLDGSPVPCLLIANKCDLSHREVEQEEIEEMCREHEFVGWTETSVKEGLMIDECMRFLIEEMVNKHAEIDGLSESFTARRGDGIRLNPDSQKSTVSGRCSC
ncbi:ras-related protein Rab-7L1-like [Haliotis rubra]|uniref:ras-related protein Rab-7L1-like n=1 Tax=Haliotis rubra TaxID=36100 RepID=UPI001EE5BE2D|nr:ras-related protein Rab-7L1-like [Haliotis rubra]XP_046574114.1 ras-related protein Rab-7L1-like [Haliotis rubra]